MRRHYINPGALIEAVISLLFGLKLFWMAYTGQYLLFVTPRMKGYLYFAALVMAVWAFSCFAWIGIPEYRQHLNRTLVLLIPLMALQLPYQALGIGEYVLFQPGTGTGGASERRKRTE